MSQQYMTSLNIYTWPCILRVTAYYHGDENGIRKKIYRRWEPVRRTLNGVISDINEPNWTNLVSLRRHAWSMLLWSKDGQSAPWHRTASKTIKFIKVTFILYLSLINIVAISFHLLLAVRMLYVFYKNQSIIQKLWWYTVTVHFISAAVAKCDVL